jgi:hypothetical protein
MSEKPSHWTGGCQCGAVRYELLAEPDHSSVCHCRMCQKASGSPIMAFSRVRKSELRWTRGTPGFFKSSNVVERGFCSACGTPLTYDYLAGGTISVTSCSLDHPDAVHMDKQYGVESELPWFAGIGALPRVTTDEIFEPEVLAQLANHQHPDHET